MSKAVIDALYTYPLKSARGYSQEKTNILNTGLEFDRVFGIINKEGIFLTARENHSLLQIGVSFINSILSVSFPNKDSHRIDLRLVNKTKIEVSLFKKKVQAQLINHSANEYLSQFLQEPVRLIYIDSNALRNVKKEYKTKANDVITFTDVAPIHLINKVSLDTLNLNLESTIKETRFRPNIVVSGVQAYEEETWKYIKIGHCEFEVIIPTERCSLITIDPINAKKHDKQEPLRTLAKDRRGSNMVNFGLYLVPRKLGEIKLLDKLEITI